MKSGMSDPDCPSEYSAIQMVRQWCNGSSFIHEVRQRMKWKSNPHHQKTILPANVSDPFLFPLLIPNRFINPTVWNEVNGNTGYPRMTVYYWYIGCFPFLTMMKTRWMNLDMRFTACILMMPLILLQEGMTPGTVFVLNTESGIIISLLLSWGLKKRPILSGCTEKRVLSLRKKTMEISAGEITVNYSGGVKIPWSGNSVRKGWASAVSEDHRELPENCVPWTFQQYPNYLWYEYFCFRGNKPFSGRRLFSVPSSEIKRRDTGSEIRWDPAWSCQKYREYRQPHSGYFFQILSVTDEIKYIRSLFIMLHYLKLLLETILKSFFNKP